jgi:PKD repeat protein
MEPDVSLIGAGYTTTVLLGNSSADVIHFPNTVIYTESTVLSGFKITGGADGIRVMGRVNSPPSPTIQKNLITGNDIGIRNRARKNQHVYTVIKDNLLTANFSAGIYNVAGIDSLSRAVVAPTIEGNLISNNGIAGIYVYVQGDLGTIGPKPRSASTIIDNIISNNGADGITCLSGWFSACEPLLVGNTISQNGGWGIRHTGSGDYDDFNPVCLSNLIFGNVEGGALFYHNDEPLFVNNTVVFNNAFGILSGNAVPTITNSIVWGHTDDLDAPVEQVSYSDVGDPEYEGSNHNLSVDPEFENPGEGDYHLSLGSPVIDVGDNNHPDLPPTDIDGEPRIMGPTVDMGADEFPSAFSVTKWAYSDTIYIGIPLTYTIWITNTGATTLHATVTDTLPAPVTPTGVLTWTPTITAPGGSWNAQVVVDVGMGYFGVLTNVVEVSTEEGVAGAFTVTSVVTEAPVTGLVATSDSPTELGAPTTLTATLASGSHVAFAWVLGDGTIGSEAVLTHTYPAVGNYVALVTASNPVSLMTATTVVEIMDVPITGLVVSNDSPTELGSPTTLSATIAAGSNVSYTWKLDDGSWQNGAIVTHTYAAVGRYAATVTASNGAGAVTATTLVSIVDVPIAGLNVENDSPTELGTPTTLSATIAAGTNVSYTWALGDGTLDAGATVVYIYTHIGQYTATVTATNGAGTATRTTLVSIVDVPLFGLVATNDSPTPLSSTTRLTATIAAGSNVSYTWRLEEGTWKPGDVVSHTYPAVDVYTALVTASNSVNLLTATTMVVITDTAILGLVATNDSPTGPGDTTTLTATVSSGSHVSYTWLFGDGAIGSGAIVTHTYLDLGLYTATVMASNPVGFAVATTTVVITDVAIAGLAAFNDSPTMLGAPTTLSATVAAGTRVSYTWLFGDGISDTGQVVTHIYPAAGRHTAAVIARNPLGFAVETTIVTITGPAPPEYYIYLPLVLRGWE